MTQRLLYSNDVDATLNTIIGGGNYNHVIVLVDNNTRSHVLPRLNCLAHVVVVEIPVGDLHKDLNTLSHVWQELEQCGATRRSLLVNLGGGVVTDLGGMAAATFKRGMHFVNVPTTLLAAVDAAVGGKTGINFMGLKNELGVFVTPVAVIVSTIFFSTLPQQELKSGFAEVLKHAMLSSRVEFLRLLNVDILHINDEDLLERLKTSLEVKIGIVGQDPTEQGIRKALNLGHTVGHALESLSIENGNPVQHGYAVAWGLVVESVLSHMTLGFPSEDLYALAGFVKENYGAPDITCEHYNHLIDLMRHDKKSRGSELNCTLLKQCGDFTIDNSVNENDLKTALDIFRDLMGL